MSLFRLAVALSCGVALMPSDKEQQKQLYDRASNAAFWAATFCDRNENTCNTAGALWETFLTKAEFAGRLGYDLAQHYYANGSPTQPVSFEKPAAGESGSAAKLEKISERADALPGPVPALEAPTKGTLRPEDLAPAWRGKQLGGV